MKKLFAILLLAIHLFNTTGYTFLFQHRMNETDKLITAQIDAHIFNDAELVQVKVPLNMPYIINTNFERADGQVEYNGIHYNYVKRKVSNDTLYLMCLPNKAKTQLAVEKSNFTKTINDISSGKKDASSSIKKGGLNCEYNHIIALYQLNKNVAASRQENVFILLTPAFVFIPLPMQPPELA